MSLREKIERRFFYWKLCILRCVNGKKMLCIPEDLLKNALATHNVDNWYLTRMYREWWMRWYVWEPLFWIKTRIKNTDARIFECGCGVGLNLLWLAQNKYRYLFGADLNPGAIQVGRFLSEKLGCSFVLWEDDGVFPQKKPENMDAIFALNWTYYSYVEGFELDSFLNTYASCLKQGGYMVMDVIDSKWNLVPNNEYLTSDWNKPESARSPSEYAKRYSCTDVVSAGEKAGLRVVHTISHASEIIPRVVYFFQREDN